MNRSRWPIAVIPMLGVIADATGQSCQPFWSGLASHNPQITLYNRLVSFDDGAGPTIYVSNPNVFDVARWRDGRWEHLGSAGLTPAEIASLAGAALFAFDDGNGMRLYACTLTCLRWENGVWVRIPAGFTSLDYSIPVASIDLGNGPRIYGKHRIPGIGAFFAWWDGAVWQDITYTSNNPQFWMVQYDDGTGPALYLFTNSNIPIGGMVTRGFAKWDGQTWTIPSLDWIASYSGNVRFTVYDDGTGPAIYTRQGFMPSAPNCMVKKWNGREWSCFANVDVPPLTIGGVNVLQVFDDGRGPALYIGGGFDGVNGHPAHNLIRYDGHSWEEVGGGVGLAWHSGIVQDARGLSMMIGYDFGFTVGGGTVDGAVLWTGCAAPQCYANCDRSSQSPNLNVLDFICFLNKFAARDPYANCNADAAINVSDFLCFLNKFAAGCP